MSRHVLCMLLMAHVILNMECAGCTVQPLHSAAITLGVQDHMHHSAHAEPG